MKLEGSLREIPQDIAGVSPLHDDKAVAAATEVERLR
jgi:hypothetical protein